MKTKTLTEKLEYINKFKFIPKYNNQNVFLDVLRELLLPILTLILLKISLFCIFEPSSIRTLISFFIFIAFLTIILAGIIGLIRFGIFTDLFKFKLSFSKKTKKRNKFIREIGYLDIDTYLFAFNELKRYNVEINDKNIEKVKRRIKKEIEIKMRLTADENYAKFKKEIELENEKRKNFMKKNNLSEAK